MSLSLHFTAKRAAYKLRLTEALEENMEISSDFNNLSFHDALVNCVRRHDDRIEIEFNFVIVTPEHSIANGDVIELKNVNVVFSEVQSENALIWHDDKAPIQHPNPHSPLREVMHGTQKQEYFHFDGFWQPDDWCEWYIYTNIFHVSGESERSTRESF